MTEFFAHLHAHSDYTLAKGASKIKDLVEAAKAAGIPAIALTDDRNMYGAMEFSMEAAKAGIQPIVGTQLWFDGGDKTHGSMVLLAQNDLGYKNVCQILSHSHRPHEGTEGGEGLIHPESVPGHTDGVIALTGGKDGCLMALLKKNRDEDARALLDWLRYEFCDRLYVEISRFGDESEEEIALEERLLRMVYACEAVECSDGIVRSHVPIVATSEIWYATKERHDAFEILKAVVEKSEKTGKGVVSVEDGKIVASSSRRYNLRTAAEMKKLFSDLPEAYDNALLLAQRCAFKVKKVDPILPTFASEGGRTEAEEMRFQSFEGLNDRFVQLGIEGDEAQKPYFERLEFELSIIERMKFPGYFLIVSDFIKWAKANDIPVGPGRGSGAGSLVAYALKITDLDPLRYGLLFERFLNPDRVSMPDFDVDFCKDRRDEVVRYVREKYGADYVSMIASYGEIKSKTAIKDVGRVLVSDEYGSYGYNETDLLTKIIPMKAPGEAKKLGEAMSDKDDRQFGDLVRKDPKARLLVESAMSVETLFRNQGIHAAGIIISGEKLNTLGPIGFDTKTGMPVSQFDGKFSEYAGLVKFDFLGLKTLSVIKECIRNIKDTTGEVINIDTISFEDEGTYQMLAEGYSNGVFQFESDGMKKWFKAMKPTRIEDLIALAALYRPGPMDMIPTYVDCKLGKATPHYPEPADRTKPFLEETFGIMVYQEQVMQVSQVVAGYSLGEADLLRRAMGKKIAEEMEKQRVGFVKGAVKNGTDEKTAGELFDTIAKFASYGFNKSHAAAYAYVAYQTAWLKRNYTAQFLAALMTYETDDKEKLAKVKEDMDTFGIKMLLPDVFKSEARFKPEYLPDGSLGIRFGLNAISGIPNELPILEEAKKGGPFKGLTDFYQRAGKQFNKGQLEKLVAAGAFDTLKIRNRYSAWEILSYLTKGGKKANENQMDMFGNTLELAVPPDVGQGEEWGDKVDREFNAVGFYFGEHPLDVYQERLKRVKVKRKASLRAWMIENNYESLRNKRLAGLVDRVERKPDRNGDPMITARILEKNDAFFARFYGPLDHVEKIRETLETAQSERRPVIILAKVSVRLDNSESDIAVYGQEVHSADDILSQERTGDILIQLNGESIKPSLDAQKAIRLAKEAVKNNQASESHIEEVTIATYPAAVERKKKFLMDFISRARSDDDQNAVGIILEAKCGNDVEIIRLPGKYLIDQSVENSIKATDGVTSMKEAQ